MRESRRDDNRKRAISYTHTRLLYSLLLDITRGILFKLRCARYRSQSRCKYAVIFICLPRPRRPRPLDRYVLSYLVRRYFVFGFVRRIETCIFHTVEHVFIGTVLNSEPMSDVVYAGSRWSDVICVQGDRYRAGGLATSGELVVQSGRRKRLKRDEGI